MMKILAVKDNAVQAYGIPIFVRHNNEGLRSFTDEINNKDSLLGKHPNDYELYEIGTYDETTGAIAPNAIPALITRGTDVEVPF